MDPLKPQIEAVPTTPEQKTAAAESKVREANLAKMRGDKNRVRDLLDEAEKLSPESVLVLEARGDFFIEASMFRKAVEEYEKAIKVKPGNVGLERKHAEAILAHHTGEWAMQEVLSGSGRYITSNGAALFSLFIPGLGQYVLEQVGRGVAFFSIWAVSWIIAIVIPNGITSLLEVATGRGSNFNAIVLFPLFLAIVTHFVAIVDASSLGKKNRVQKVERPVPLVDKEF